MAKAKKPKISFARKTSNVPTKVFTYGATPCQPEQLSTVFDQMFKAHQYKCACIKIKNRDRARYRFARSCMDPRLKELEGILDGINSQIEELRKGYRQKKFRSEPDQVEITHKIEALKAQRKPYYAEAKVIKERITEENTGGSQKAYAKELKSRLAQAALDRHLALVAEGKASPLAEGVLPPSLGPNSNLRAEITIQVRKEMRESSGSRLWKVLNKISLNTSNSLKRARGASGCAPGVYQDIDKAITQSYKNAVRDPRMKTYDRRGKVGIQLTQDKGLSITKALSGASPNLKITVNPVSKVRKSKSDIFYPSHANPIDQHAKWRAQRAQLRKVGAMKKSGKPHQQSGVRTAKVSIKLRSKGPGIESNVFLDFQIVIHRPLPEDGVIKWAYLYVNRIGYRTTYELQLTIESETFNIQDSPAQSNTILAVGTGWRVQPNGDVCVATTWDGEKESHVIIPSTILEGRKEVNLLLGHADDHFDLAIRSFCSWAPTVDPKVLYPLLLKAMPGHLRNQIKTLSEELRSIRNWRSHEKLRKVAFIMQSEFLTPELVKELWGRWKSTRLNPRTTTWKHHLNRKRALTEGNPQFKQKSKDLYDDWDHLAAWFAEQNVTDPYALMALTLVWWSRKDDHLINWARGLDRRLVLWRRELYRKQAASWFQGYQMVAIEDWDKRKTAENPDAEDDTDTPQEKAANAVRQNVGVSVLTQALAAKFGHRLIKVPPRGLAATHHGCGGTVLDSIECASAGCTKCSVVFDRKLNVAKNLWTVASSLVDSETLEPLAVANCE